MIMTDRITPNVLENIERLLNDHRVTYNIPKNIRLFIVDTLATQEENLILAVRQLFTGRRIKKQDTLDAILQELHAICGPKLSMASMRPE
jgi:hypothetical protein